MSGKRIRGTIGVEPYMMYGVKQTVGVGMLWTSAWNPEDIKVEQLPPGSWGGNILSIRLKPRQLQGRNSIDRDALIKVGCCSACTQYGEELQGKNHPIRSVALVVKIIMEGPKTKQ